jgi:hypothetical protein
VLLFNIAAVHHLQAAADAQQHGSLDGGTQCNRLLRVNFTPAGRRSSSGGSSSTTETSDLQMTQLDSFVGRIASGVIRQ